ncbi:fibrinogen-like protein A [Anopheles darlingi]|uniref:fibrinogen-like protein A n=1 Tax=Anopheles darlingi TaxID=43151 RepID=UPI00210053E5|nr:fibrinogen-like protein A [Anopheles darlingi]
MKTILWFVLCCCALSARASNQNTIPGTTPLSDEISGFSLELLLTKLDYIQHMQEKLHDKLFAAVGKLESEIGRNFSKLQERSSQQGTCVNHGVIGIPEIPKHNTTASTTEQIAGLAYSSCREVPSNVSGSYLIRVNNESEPFRAYCEQQAFDGGWLVVQHRFDGSLEFFRYWSEYRNGFGDVEKEFWLGLEKLHQLTTERPHELIIEIKDFRDYYAYVRHNSFAVGSESEKYRLKALGASSGTAGDALAYGLGMQFSTQDRDNDRCNVNCAAVYKGAWWYNTGPYSNLNGLYMNSSDGRAMVWYTLTRTYIGMSYSRMMIRPLK